MMMANTSVIEERDEILVIIDEGQVRTVPKSPYYLLKYKTFEGNRIFYKFTESISVQETFDEGIFNCYYGKNLVQIRDGDEVCLAIQTHAKENSLEQYKEVFSNAWSAEHKDEIVSWFLQEFFSSGRLILQGSKYVIDGVFAVDDHSNAYALNKRERKDDEWKSVCLVVQGNLSAKEMMFKGVPTLIDVTTQSIISKILFCLKPDTMDSGFMVQLPSKLRRWVERGNINAEVKWSYENRFSENKVSVPKGTGYFPTPEDVVTQLIDLAELEDGMSVLEPSAGQGHILKGLKGQYKITCGELFSGNQDVLKRKGYVVEFDDFMEFATSRRYDRIVMNPPFEGQADIDHVLHAFSLLQKNGRLVSVMSKSVIFREDKKTKQFRELLEKHGHWVELPADSFKESGTGVHTVIVVMNKNS